MCSVILLSWSLQVRYNYSDVGLPNTFLHQHNWFTKLIDQVSLFYQHLSMFSPVHSKENGLAQSFIIYAVTKFLVHPLTPGHIIPPYSCTLNCLFYCFLMGIRFSSIVVVVCFYLKLYFHFHFVWCRCFKYVAII